MSDGVNPRYPFPQDYVDQYAARLFRAIAKGECVTPVWVATAGRRVVDRFIIDNIHLFSKFLPDYQKYLLCYVEPLDLTEESQAGYLRLIGKTFIEACQKNQNLDCDIGEADLAPFDNELLAYPKLLEHLKILISKATKSGMKVVLFLGEIDELGFVNNVFSNNLRSLWNSFDDKLHYVFLIKDLRLLFEKNPYGEELGYLFFQNLLFVPVSKDNEEYLLEFFQKKYDYVLSPLEKQLVSEMCDGHPYLLKLAFETLAKTDSSDRPFTVDKIKELFRSNYEIRATSDLMLGIFTQKMKKLLHEVASKQIVNLPNDEETNALLALGIIRTSPEGYYQLFCQLFRDAVLKRALPEVLVDEKQTRLSFDENTRAITFNGKSIEDQFTRQEYEILAYFLQEPDKIHSRDVLAEKLWGKESYEKYSDWAIDQLMSKLRKKLAKIGLKDSSITTIRGRGYKLGK